MNLIRLIAKNLKIIGRNKITLLALLLGPLFIVAISGMAFNNTSAYDIKIGIYDEGSSDMSNQFADNLDGFFMVNYFYDRSQCVNSIITHNYHACIILPKNMSVNGKNNISLYYDNSKVNIASSIKEKIFFSIGETSTNISEELTIRMIESIVFAENKLKSNLLLIGDAKKNIVDGSSLTDSSKLTLSNTKLDFNEDKIRTSSVQNEANKIKSSFDDFKKLSADISTSIEKSLDEILEESTDGNITSIVSSAKSSVSKFKSDVDKINTTASLAELSLIISDISLELDKIKNSIGTAKSNNALVSSNLDKIKNNLNVAKSSVDNIEKNTNEILNKFLENSVRDASSITNPVNVEDFEIVTGSKLNYLYPNLLILVIMFITIISSATQVINEKLNKAKQRMDMTPSPFLTTSIATFFTIIIISIVQLSLVLLITHFFFKIDIITSIYPIIFVLLISCVFFTLLGISIGNLFNTEHTVMLASITVSSFFLILSDLILPIESMPPKLIEILQYTPFLIATDILRKVMFFDIPMADIRSKYNVLIIYCLAILFIMFISSLIYNLSKKTKANIIARKVSTKSE